MIGPICLIAVGAFGALYFTHKTFRDRVHDLCSHVKNLFVTKEAPASQVASSAVTTTPAVTPTVAPVNSGTPIPQGPVTTSANPTVTQ